MTVSSTTNKDSYGGDGLTVAFSYTFRILDDDDISVIVRTDATGSEAVKVKTTDYSVSGVGEAGGGTITFVTAPASGETVVLLRNTPLTQATDYTPNDPFPAATHEDALDKLTFIVQDMQEELDRSIKVSKTNTITSTEFTIGASDRANKIFAFDSDGDFAVTQEIGTYRGTDATTTTSSYSERDIVKSTTAAQLNNVYICVQDSPSGTLLTNTTYWQLLVDAVSAATSATNAASSATAAAASAVAAATSETNAATSATNAAASEASVAADAAAAAASASAAATSETNAATSETNAATSATSSATSATASAASATAAAASETAAATSETNAATSASNASTSETNAAASASAASTSATNAATSAANASTSATNAATSETNAATSASAAAASQTAAATSAAAAASAFDNFDDTYLGSKTADPTVDNDGDPLTTGDLYFNSTANEMRVYDGANWIPASSAGGVSLILYEYTATSGQTTFSGADDNAATLSYTADNIQVVMNGIVLDPSDFTATNGTSVVLATGAAANDIVNVYAFKSFTVADTVSASAGGTFSGNVTVNALLNVDNIRIDGNTISSTDTNGDITLDPDGTGKVAIPAAVEVDSNDIKIAFDGADDVNSLILEGSNGSSEKYTFQLQADGGGSAAKFMIGSGGGAASEKMRIASGGNVGINEPSPTNRLHVNGNNDVGTIRVHSGLLNQANKYNGIVFSGESSHSKVGIFQVSDVLSYNRTKLVFATNNGANSNNVTPSDARLTIANGGNVIVHGSLSKGSGSFRIDHPLPAKNSTHELVHSFIEGPQADLIYRGKVDLVAGSATVDIDAAAGMTEGTFVLLCGEVQCFTSNEGGFTAVKGSVSGNTLTITAEDNTCTDTISWMVIGERKDQHMIDTEWTDENGKVIVEPLKEQPIQE